MAKTSYKSGAISATDAVRQLQAASTKCDDKWMKAHAASARFFGAREADVKKALSKCRVRGVGSVRTPEKLLQELEDRADWGWASKEDRRLVRSLRADDESLRTEGVDPAARSAHVTKRAKAAMQRAYEDIDELRGEDRYDAAFAAQTYTQLHKQGVRLSPRHDADVKRWKQELIEAGIDPEDLKGLGAGPKKPRKKARSADKLRDMETPVVLGIELDRETLTPARRSINLDTPGDYGADPLGDGLFRMVPSGDIVDYAERTQRLERMRRRQQGLEGRGLQGTSAQHAERAKGHFSAADQELEWAASPAVRASGSQKRILAKASRQLTAGMANCDWVSSKKAKQACSAEEKRLIRKLAKLEGDERVLTHNFALDGASRGGCVYVVEKRGKKRKVTTDLPAAKSAAKRMAGTGEAKIVRACSRGRGSDSGAVVARCTARTCKDGLRGAPEKKRCFYVVSQPGQSRIAATLAAAKATKREFDKSGRKATIEKKCS